MADTATKTEEWLKVGLYVTGTVVTVGVVVIVSKMIIKFFHGLEDVGDTAKKLATGDILSTDDIKKSLPQYSPGNWTKLYVDDASNPLSPNYGGPVDNTDPGQIAQWGKQLYNHMNYILIPPDTLVIANDLNAASTKAQIKAMRDYIQNTYNKDINAMINNATLMPDLNKDIAATVVLFKKTQ